MPRRTFRNDREIGLSHAAPFPPPPQEHAEWNNMCVHDPSITSRAAGFHDLRGQVGISPPRHGGASPEGVLIAKENAPRTPPQLLRCSRKPAASASMIYF